MGAAAAVVIRRGDKYLDKRGCFAGFVVEDAMQFGCMDDALDYLLLRGNIAIEYFAGASAREEQEYQRQLDDLRS
jgi:hypothetical protein